MRAGAEVYLAAFPFAEGTTYLKAGSQNLPGGRPVSLAQAWAAGGAGEKCVQLGLGRAEWLCSQGWIRSWTTCLEGRGGDPRQGLGKKGLRDRAESG